MLAFLFGGLICCIGQGISQIWTALGADKDSAASATSITLVFLGALLTGLGVYDDIARLAGAGTLVPINRLCQQRGFPALEFKPRASSPAQPRKCSS